MEAIYAIDSNYGLSQKGIIPWKSRRDMIFFKNKTKNNIVIMGRNTYFSLSKPLENRLNIVLTKDPNIYSNEIKKYDNVIFTDNDNIDLITIKREKYPFLQENYKIFIIGGKQIYEKFIPLCKYIWITHLKKDYFCDLFINYVYSNHFQKELIDENEEFIIYKYTNLSSIQ
jgi:dihydrofolate reductase